MSNIHKAFSHGKAFIPFITCGDPSLEVTKDIVIAMAQEGADLIELGIPFSDPTAEGATIMNANTRSLNAGTTTEKVLKMAQELRSIVQIPMVFMTYANVLFSYGSEAFIKASAQIGIDGFIIPDVPYEEKQEFSELCKEYERDFISMIAPTSKERIAMIAKEASGFLYCVSSTGVTGMRSEITTDVQKMVEQAKQAKNIPCAIGFGISNPAQAAQMARYADGVIIGSAIVKMCEQYARSAPEHIARFTKEVKLAINA